MAREKELYREHLAELREAFGGQTVISLRQAAKYLRKKPETLLGDRSFPVKKTKDRYWITLVAFASWLS